MSLQTHTPPQKRIAAALGDGANGGGGDAGGDGWGFGGYHSPRLAVARTGLWLFIATATVVFSMLLSTYLVRQGWPDWHLLPRPGILWLNTFWLALSSGLIEWAKRSARRPDPGQWRAGFFSAGALALLFLIGQLAAWREMSAAGHLLGTTPASSFFYLLTALHAIHTWGGLVAWSWVAAKLVARTDVEVRARLGLCAIYWHFLLIVWLVILSLIWFTK